jgi:Clr5 domain
MPRSTVDINAYREEIIRFRSQKTAVEIVQYLQTTYDLSISERTLNRRLKEWGISVYTTKSVDSDLLNRIRELFFLGLNDTQILRTLKIEDHTITLRGVERLRIKELNLKRRLRTEDEQEASKEKALSELIDELQKGVVEGYGRGLLYAHFQELGVQVSRDRLFGIYRALVPEAIDRRTRDMQRHRGEYIVPGPNFIWSIDAYLKLSPYGIEVYAAIDAYSRFIVWIYIGISARTAISVLRQYLDTIEVLGQHPRFVRSDHGTETVLLASAHYQLQQIAQPNLEFRECYMYGTSTANQRIESWWNQLSKGLLFRWRVCYRTVLFFKY